MAIVVGKRPSVETFDAVFAKVEEELLRHRSFCVAVDAEQTESIDFAHVKRFAAFGEKNRSLLEAYIRALAFVIPSPAVRGAMKVAFQLSPPPHPVKICRTKEQAKAYLEPYVRHLG